ncbi:protein neuralized isoform X2 [Anopheles aquasalis]|uniref:protein neuralized isoform X2 n=1 Tax=Anopheles aquasalis TaxID=42839 RepID=UPI00215A4EFF|nr:protein neuralized isoform X2 [Anopheles aquasalis]
MGQTISSSATRSASSCPGPNNLPPLQFHTVHGDNIRISREGTVAKRYESFCKGITFSARPVRVNERVCVKFLDISSNWSGVIRFGFTCNDPASLRGNLPKYACPDLTNKPGFWAKALNERYCYRNNVLFYYVTPSGDVHFGINGEEKGVFITDVDARGPLWAVIDVYGNSTAIEFLDSRIYMFQAQQQQQQHHQQHHQHHQHHGAGAQSQRRSTDQEIVPQLESLSINQHNHQLMEDQSVRATVQVPPMAACGSTAMLSPTSAAASVRYNSPAPGLLPLPFHPVRGRNIKFSADRYIATRADIEFCQGYVFSPRPVKIGERLIIQILKTDSLFVGSLALGLTSCDPATLQLNDLPDDSDMLLDRPEYWVVSKDVASTLVRGDELCFSVTVNGEVQISKNGGPPSVIMHIDQSLQLWAFLDVYGSTQSVRLFSHTLPVPSVAGSCASSMYEVRSHSSLAASSAAVAASSQSVNRNLQVQMQSVVGASCSSSSSGPGTMMVAAESQASLASAASCRTIAGTATVRPDMIQINPGGTVLVVNLPPADVLSQQQQQQQQHQQSQPPQQATIVTRGMTGSASTLSVPLSTLSLSSHTGSTGTGTAVELMATNNNNNNNYAASNGYPEALPSYNNAANYSTVTGAGPAAATATGGIYSSTNCVDCTICFEKPIDSVLYMCGHMCMCYDCAIKQWRGIGGGHCPLCRAVIRDVIRTYKS